MRPANSNPWKSTAATISPPPQIALPVWLAVHKDDMALCEQSGVPLLTYSGGRGKLYIGFRECKLEATSRLVQVAGETCNIRTPSSFSPPNLPTKAFLSMRPMPSELISNFKPGFAKRHTQTIPKTGESGLHVDLPLVKYEDAQLLISSEWMSIE